MTDSPDPDLIAFTPVPVRARGDGWTPERQRRFIQALSLIGVVAAAARAVGKSATAAYNLRARPDADSFAEAWDIAQSMAGDRAYEQAIDRALNGVEVPRFYRGVQVGSVRRPDYRLAFKVLDHHLARSRPTIDLGTALAMIGDEIPPAAASSTTSDARTPPPAPSSTTSGDAAAPLFRNDTAAQP